MTIPVPGMFKDSIAIESKGASSYVNGLLVESQSTSQTLQATVQPASPRDFQHLSEGMRGRETQKVYSGESLTAGSESGANKGDIMTYKGKTYEIQAVWVYSSPWFHWKALAVEVDGQ